MDDIAKRVTNLSPTKRALFELKLKQKAAAVFPEREPETHDIVRRVANLSIAKRILLELKLRQREEAAKSSESKPATNDITEQIARLSPTKRTLLELKLRKMAATPSSVDRSATDDIITQIVNLSPAKRALLEFRLRKGAISSIPIDPSPTITPEIEAPGEITSEPIEVSSYITEDIQDVTEPPAEPIEEPTSIIEDTQDAAEPITESLEELIFAIEDAQDAVEPTVEPLAEPTSTAKTVQDAAEPPAEPLEELILTIKDAQDVAEPIAEPIEEPISTTEDVQDASEAIVEPPEEPPSTTKDAQEVAAPEVSNWLADLQLEDLDAPSWLSDGVGDEKVSPVPDSGTPDFEKEAELPGWLSGLEDTTTLSDEFPLDQEADSSPATVASPTIPPARTSKWLESLKPDTEEAVTDEGDNKTAEATGMLSGISTLLPTEKIAIPTRETGNLQAAAQEFYKIATEAPQPATLPTPLTVQERAIGSVVRSVLYLLFIALIALPLLPGTNRMVNDLPVPWSEPMGIDSEVLDSQRRQLISEQLGIIDLQQPGSVALVSFDYSTATQGEMQPLAEAVIGRLKGQGMRVISVSLEPEGATIAQNTLEKMLAEDEKYGVNTVNLGYLPGQIAAIRALITNQESLSTIPDYKENSTLNTRSEWEDVQNLDQVDIIVTFSDNPTTARWWVEQLEAAPQSDDRERFLLAATSAVAEPFLRPYRDSKQLDGLISGVNGAAAIEAGRNRFGQGRQMIDSIGIATIIIVILIAAGTIVGWKPEQLSPSSAPVSENESDESG